MADARAEQTQILVLSARLDERSEEHTSELQSQSNLECRLLLEKKTYTIFAFTCPVMVSTACDSSESRSSASASPYRPSSKSIVASFAALNHSTFGDPRLRATSRPRRERTTPSS